MVPNISKELPPCWFKISKNPPSGDTALHHRKFEESPDYLPVRHILFYISQADLIVENSPTNGLLYIPIVCLTREMMEFIYKAWETKRQTPLDESNKTYNGKELHRHCNWVATWYYQIQKFWVATVCKVDSHRQHTLYKSLHFFSYFLIEFPPKRPIPWPKLFQMQQNLYM
jgi:hypothetical protein